MMEDGTMKTNNKETEKKTVTQRKVFVEIVIIRLLLISLFAFHWQHIYNEWQWQWPHARTLLAILIARTQCNSNRNQRKIQILDLMRPLCSRPKWKVNLNVHSRCAWIIIHKRIDTHRQRNDGCSFSDYYWRMAASSPMAIEKHKS